MTALVNSFKRIWSAKNWVPRLTGWGTPGSRQTATEKAAFVAWSREPFLELIAAARRTAPTVIVVALNIFR